MSKNPDLDRSKIGKRLAHMEREMAEIKELLQLFRPKRGLSFAEAVPPQSVCKDALSKVRGNCTYEGMLSFLASYYSVPRMNFQVNKKKVPAKCNAAYYPSENTAYSSAEIVDNRTALHEFSHHLIAHKVIRLDGKEEEGLADNFAQVFLARARNE